MKKILFVLLLANVAASAQKNYSSILDKYMEAQAQVNEFSGAVMVAQKGAIIYKKGFGLANREWNIPNTAETKFMIGSVTKQFTAAAILQLVDKGKLSLEDKLSKFFPDFPKGDSVTIHMLLNHTSGIKSYTDMPSFAAISTMRYPKDSVVSYFKKEPFDFSPGKRYHYNNSGYFLLGYIIEKITGQTYGDYVHDNLIAKAGLRHTSVNRLDSILPNRAASYVKRPTGWFNAAPLSMEFPYSAGAIVSNVDDLYQWQQALYGGKIIASETFAKMTTPYFNRYGYGLRMDSLANHRRIAHGGSIGGFLSVASYFPLDDLHVIVLSNNSSDAPGIGQGLAAIMMDKEVTTPYGHKEIKVDGEKVKKFVGLYKASDNTLIEIVQKGNKLFRMREGASDMELKPETENSFFYANRQDYLLQFDTDATGKVVGGRLNYFGVVNPFKRLNEDRSSSTSHKKATE